MIIAGDMVTKRQRAEVWTWRLVAGLSASVVQAFVTEEHAAYRQYDEIVACLPRPDGERVLATHRSAGAVSTKTGIGS